jgi:uncharacterized membrane protein YfcA
VTPPEALAILAAGFAAGTINTIVGSGSLITFPVLLALGYPPLVANVSNTVGLVPGSISGAIGYRRELSGQRARILRLASLGGLGGLSGGLLLLALPSSAFERVVPYLILGACLLVAIGPRLSAAMTRRRERGGGHGPVLGASVYATAVYGGYFGAAQGVILMAIFGIFIPDDLQRLNALKNLVAAVVNAVAAILFILVAPLALEVVLLVAAGSIVGGQAGAQLGRRLPAPALRFAIIAVGTLVGVRLLVA